MQFVDGRLLASPTDLANFLTCRHKTALDLGVATGALAKPTWVDPLAETLQKRGEAHEKAYIERLRAAGQSVLDLSQVPYEERVARTRDAILSRSADVIYQAAFRNDAWHGYADVLRRTASGYEAVDTKLARETRGGTILQLCVYSGLLAETAGDSPLQFHVVTPVADEPYRVADYAALYRQLKREFLDFVRAEQTTYPEPVSHCEVCRWSARCDRQRRRDDHLSLVHGLGRNHVKELAAQNINTLASLAAMPLPLTFIPGRGAKETYEKLREQARLQLEQRTTGHPTFECLPVESGFGLAALPEPRPGDLFLDLEGDPFGRPAGGPAAGESQREYLFGLGHWPTPGAPMTYIARWAMTDAEERAAFEATLTDMIAALGADPDIHIYHYGHYEPSAFKRLMGRYAVREADVDRLLRGRRFVDLLAVVRRGIRAGIERYSIKDLEPFYGFKRDIELDLAGDQRRIVELALETGDDATVTASVRAAVEGYNRDDVRSTGELRAWLETVRTGLINKGKGVERPVTPDDKPSADVDERAQRVGDLRARLLESSYLLAYLLDFHRREAKAEWWDYFRLRELPESDLLDEPKAVAGLSYVEDTGREKRSVVQRYTFPEQDIDIRSGATLKRQTGQVFAEAVRVDRVARTIDMLVGPSRLAGPRPTALFAHDYVPPRAMEDSLFALGEQVAAAGSVEALPSGPARSLLLRLPPQCDLTSLAPAELIGAALGIQGPPGAGKTYTGARMIESCVAAGLKVGVTANSHKVIRNLLKEIESPNARVGQRCSADDIEAHDGAGIALLTDNAPAATALASGEINVLGGTAWLWARPEFAGAVDVLFVDEAGQVSLANALAVARAARGIVLLGDPQQLDQPTKGSHPDGIGVSALQHILGEAETMPADRGLFLPVTWRLAPPICRFTSESFYAGKLTSKPSLERQALRTADSPLVAGGLRPAGRFDGSGLWYVAVEHFGNQTSSDEEARVVTDIVGELLAPDSMWIDEHGAEHRMTPDDIRIITPFNAQVMRIREALVSADVGRGFSPGGLSDVPVGTVDKFQGQEAAVSIYSMATSHPDDAPRGMEFLYSLNRLNVATSRARCAAILVASPRLFEPDCQTPHRMRLANALVRFREMASQRRD